MELDLKPIELPGIEKKRPMIIAGPCSCLLYTSPSPRDS